MTHKIIANVSELTRRQIDEIAEQTGITTTAAIVAMAIDRMYAQEVTPRSYATFLQLCDVCEFEPTPELFKHWQETGLILISS